MISAEKHNDNLLGIFYSYFHNIEGPKLACQYPYNCITLDTFNGISDFVIPKDPLCREPLRVSVDSIEIVGYPIQISNTIYGRNSFNFNLCFVVVRGESRVYETMVKKIALKLERLEIEKGFLRNPEDVSMQEIIKNIYVSLKESNNCDIWLDSFTRLLLFPIADSLSLAKAIYSPEDYEVPFLLYPYNDIIHLLPDSIMFDSLLRCIDGLRCVYELQSIVEYDEFQLRSCLSFLYEVSAIRFIDIFDVCNIYAIQDYEKIWDIALIEKCIEYSRVRIIANHASDKRVISSPHHVSVIEVASEKVSVEDVQVLLSQFQYNVNLYQILQSSAYKKLHHVIDIHRFVVYCCVYNLLKRVYLYPTIALDSSSFYMAFSNTLTTSRQAINPSNDDVVGMSMDSGANVGTKREEEEDKDNIEYRRKTAKGWYNELFKKMEYSIFHTQIDHRSLSRHSSALSFHQDWVNQCSCNCKPDCNAIKKYLNGNYCLDYISLHTNCCKPSIIHSLENLDIIYLKK